MIVSAVAFVHSSHLWPHVSLESGGGDCVEFRDLRMNSLNPFSGPICCKFTPKTVPILSMLFSLTSSVFKDHVSLPIQTFRTFFFIATLRKLVTCSMWAKSTTTPILCSLRACLSPDRTETFHACFVGGIYVTLKLCHRLLGMIVSVLVTGYCHWSLFP